MVNLRMSVTGGLARSRALNWRLCAHASACREVQSPSVILQLPIRRGALGRSRVDVECDVNGVMRPVIGCWKAREAERHLPSNAGALAVRAAKLAIFCPAAKVFVSFSLSPLPRPPTRAVPALLHSGATPRA